MSSEAYKDKIQIANKAVEGLNLDADLRKSAFEAVLADLLNREKKDSNVHVPRKIKKRDANPTNPPNNEENNTDIMAQINAEDFPHIHSLSSKLQRSLYLLKVLRDKNIADGLIPSQIAKILTEKFRIKANQFNIGMALSKAREYLDRDKIVTRGGIAYKYKIMKKGEDYVAESIANIDKNQEETAEDT